jgi:hypothetical protein
MEQTNTMWRRVHRELNVPKMVKQNVAVRVFMKKNMDAKTVKRLDLAYPSSEEDEVREKKVAPKRSSLP